VAEALATLGLKRGYVVHGLDGLDEITTTGETRAFEIRGGAIAEHTLTPEHFGVPVARAEDLKGADKETNRQIALQVLRGGTGPKRDIVLVNAAVALVAAGKADDFLHGMRLAGEVVDNGSAMAKLEAMAAFTNIVKA
jgi:anthranilate phosphoribosyltransferase